LEKAIVSDNNDEGEPASRLELYRQINDLLKLLGQQQTMLYALHEYLREQPFYDAAKFRTIFQEFQTDIIAALKKRATPENDAILKMLEAFQGRPH
jgi:hypothetical protein